MLTFDAENRVTTYGSLLSAGYNGDGLRVWKQGMGTGTRTYYLYDGTDLFCELNASGAVTAANTWGANGLVSRRTGTTSVFYAFDPQGNVAQRTDDYGQVLSQDLYDAYGTRRAGNPGNDVYGYNGQWGYYTDTETGFILCTYRYYDPVNARWLTRDPIGYEGGVNLYGYVGNDPVNHVDPEGLVWWNPFSWRWPWSKPKPKPQSPESDSSGFVDQCKKVGGPLATAAPYMLPDPVGIPISFLDPNIPCFALTFKCQQLQHQYDCGSNPDTPQCQQIGQECMTRMEQCNEITRKLNN